MTNDFVTVVIPAYNAAATIDEALRSARAQTYRAMEIVVVDDGSSDATAEIARRHAAEDPRIRVLSQQRRGSSAARNVGIRAAVGDLIAPLDADDLWRPTKIARQVAAMAAGGPKVGLAYTWFASIDDKGRIRSIGHQPTDSGYVLRSCCRRNLIGNGSGALMRKSAILECGGYDETLRGCEDLKLYTAIAERHHYAVVPEHLTGYRQTNRNITSDVLAMRESADIVLADFENRFPQFRAELRDMRRGLYRWLLMRGLMAGRLMGTWTIARALWKLDRSFALLSFASTLKLLAKSSVARIRFALPRERPTPNVPPFLADQTPL